jgi:uncharacterized protein YdaU (DUF1376 family)
MKFFTGDFAGDTLHLDATEIGAYLLLIMASWQSKDRMLPNDDKVLGRIARIHDYRLWKRVKANVLPYFTVTDDGAKLYHRRVQVELDLADNRGAKARANILKRWYGDNTPVHNHSQLEEVTPTGLPSSNFAGPRARSARGYARTPRKKPEVEPIEDLEKRVQQPGVKMTKEEAIRLSEHWGLKEHWSKKHDVQH